MAPRNPAATARALMLAGQRGKTGQGPSPVSPLVASFNGWAFGRPANVLPRPADQFLTGAFGPEQPLVPMPVDQPTPDGTLEPRRTQYPVAWNLPVGVPGSEGLGKLASFNTLRAMADKVSVFRAALNRRVQEVVGLEWDIVPTKDAEEAMKDDVGYRTDWQRRHVQMMRFWERPDRAPDSPYFSWEEWMIALLEDSLVTDAVALYFHPPLGGKGTGWFGSSVGSLDLIDGTTIRPLYSMSGGLPSPSAVAYQQFLWGVPRSDFATIAEGRDKDELPDYVDTFASSELMYCRTWPRTWSPYGFSAVEQAILPIAILYARQTQQLEFYTEGTVPYTYVVPGPELVQSPQQIRQLQNALNAISGDTGWKQKVVVLPPGSKTEMMKPYDQASDFDYLISTYAIQPLGLTPSDIGMIPSMGNGSSGFSYESARMVQQNQDNAKDRWLEPFVTFWGRQFNRVIQGVFRQTDMEWHWTGMEQGQNADDLIEQQINLFKNSLGTIDEGRSQMGLDTFGAAWSQIPWIITGTGAVPIDIAYDQAKSGEATVGGPAPAGDEQPAQSGAGGAEHPHAGAGSPVQTRASEDRRGQPTIPAHDAARRVEHEQQDRPHNHAGKHPIKAMVTELEVLERLLRKGRDVESFEAHVLPDAVMEAVKVAMPGGVDAAVTAGHLAIADEVKKRPKAAGLIVKANDTGRVLMVQRNGDNHNRQAAGKWEWPGGKLDDGEDALDAARREWQEEVGVDLPDGKVVGEWRSGRYVGFVYVIKHEADVDLSDRDADRNPDKGPFEPAAWWDLSDIHGNPAMRVEVQASDWALIGSAKKFVPKAGAPADAFEPAPLPWHLVTDADLKVVHHYEPLLAVALSASIKDLREGIRQALQVAGSIPKANGPQNAVARVVAEVVAAVSRIVPQRLIDLVKRIWADAYMVGSHSAAEQAKAQPPEYLRPVMDPIDWSTWEPGDPEAALQAAGGGLARLLADANLTIQGIDQTTVNRIGDIVADGIASGAPVDDIAGEIERVVLSASRAELIARTEVSRAMAAAEFETYREAGVEEWNWMDAPGACPVCQQNKENGPYPVGGGPTLPAHPRCRCAPEPVIK